MAGIEGGRLVNITIKVGDISAYSILHRKYAKKLQEVIWL